jgi:ribonucleotide reductase beta subunit family protein with ferritin-like domain
MSIDEQNYVKHIVSFSAVSDQLVNANLLNRFLVEICDSSAIRFLSQQVFIEEQHKRTYGEMLMTIVPDRAERIKLMSPHENEPTIAKKVAWIEKWINSDADIGQRLVAFIIVEGVFFSSLFCGFYWLKNRGSKLPGLIQANEFISRDETMHWEFSAMLLEQIVNKPSRATIEAMFREAVEIEHYFVDGSLPRDLHGMNANQMKQYVEYVTDFVLQRVPCADPLPNSSYVGPIYNTPNPFGWMLNMSISVLTNYFERVPTNYQHLGKNKDELSAEFGLDADF